MPQRKMTLVSPTIVDDKKHGLGIECYQGCQDPPTFSHQLYVTYLVFTDSIGTLLAVLLIAFSGGEYQSTYS